ncbi:MAG: hypothetical protein DMD78_08645 [Candidatus Rokuibacteriota bacterium]|nr:MAG: hypothetical protein DMD78_08645 [Candidatus Rokubacteria bacterium]
MRFVGRGTHYRLWLTDGEAVFAPAAARAGDSAALRLRLVGSAPASSVTAEQMLPGKVHYVPTLDASTWRRDVPTYRRVVYREVYPGIDLVFHGDQQELEFDFVVAAGADPRAIRFEMAGADRLALADGDVVVQTRDGDLRLRKPVVYQEHEGRRVPVDGRFTLHGRRVAFDVGDYDRGRPLVIDPVVTYSTYLSGAGGGALGAAGVGVDAAGNMYAIAGTSIMKLSADGATLLYSVVLGDATPITLTADGAGNAYVISQCPYNRSGLTFNCPAGSLGGTAPHASAQGDVMGMITKLSPSGQVLFSSTVGGNGSVFPTGVALDPAGNIYVTGWGVFHDFRATRPPFAQPGVTDGFPAFIEAIAADTSRYLYVVEFLTGGDGAFRPVGIAVDAAGAAYVTGKVGQKFPTTPGAYQTTTNGSTGAGAVAKVAPDGSALVYGTYFGDVNVTPGAIAVDGAGNAYIVGHAGSGLPTTNALQPTPAGGQDAFVTKLSPSGSALVFSTYLGGSQDDAATGVALDGSGKIYVAGGTDSADFPQSNALPTTFGSAGSNFVTALTPAGTQFVYSTYFADAQSFVNAMTATSNGTVYVTGATSSTSYPTVRPYQATPGGNFLARIEPGTSACATGQFFAEYFSNIALTPPATRTACESTINNNYGAGGPTGLPTDNFSARWTGRFPFAAGNVTFTARADDGVRVFLDGAVIIDQWHDQAATTYTATRTVTAGEHEVRVEYYERGGDAVVQVSWAGNTAAPAPTLTTLTPSRATAGGPAFTLTADGTNFASGATVLWNGAARTTTFVSATRVTASISAADIAAAGSVPVTVRNPNGQTSGPQTFTIAPAGGGDTIKVFITEPASGATVRGMVWFTVWIENAAAGPKTYTLSVGTSTITSTTTTSNGPVSLAWPTSAPDNGSRTATVTVRDGANATGRASITVNVTN